MNVKVTLISIFILTTCNLSMAQDIMDHEFVGRVLIDGKKAKDVTVKAFEENKCFSSYETKSSGRFVFSGGSEKYYALQFEKEGYVTKRIIIKTYNTRDLEFDTRTYKFDIDLIMEVEGVNYDEYDFPVAIIEIGDDGEEFTHNKQYAEDRLESIKLNGDGQIASK